MMKKLFRLNFIALFLLCLVTACSSDDEKSDDLEIEIPNKEELTQTAYADEENTGSGFSFVAKSTWTASTTETTVASAVSQVFSSTTTRTSGVQWLKLTQNGTEINSGKAGSFTLSIVLEPNYTGKERSARIDIICGSDKISIVVTQEGKTEDGKLPEDPNPVKPTDSITGYDEEKLSQTFFAESSEGSFTFTSSATWTSTLGVEKKWFSYSPKQGAAGEHTINFTLAPNFSKAERSDTITIACGEAQIELVIKQQVNGKEGKPLVRRVVEISGIGKIVYDDQARIKQIGSVVYTYPSNDSIACTYGDGSETGYKLVNGAISKTKSSTYTYNNGYLTKIVLQIIQQSQPRTVLTEYYWSSGALSKIHGNFDGVAGGTFETSLEYNNTEYLLANLDINYLTSAYQHYTGGILSAFGYTGKYLSKNLISRAITVDPDGGKYNATRTFRYTFDLDGYVTEIYEKNITHGSAGSENLFCTISYE